MIPCELDPDFAAELAAEDQLRRRYHRRIGRHGDCRDPDHPGCEFCEDEDEEE